MFQSKDLLQVAVIDMQPIDPPIGGGRIRLLGLYHNLGDNFSTSYIGTYDWPGPGYRRHKLSKNLEEINIPLSHKHFEISEKWKSFAGGQTVIDTAFPLMANLSRDFVKGVQDAIRIADIVIFSHPWVYPLARDVLNAKQLIVYDAHNFEGLLRTELLDNGGFGSEIAKHVVITEFELAQRADIVLACSKEDCLLFNKVYNVQVNKTFEIPNGVFTSVLQPPTNDQKNNAKHQLKINGNAAIFLGSAYGPNIEAVEFICNTLAPKLLDINFLICGGVADAPQLASIKDKKQRNVQFVGFIPEEEKLKYLWAADIAINPMFSGSGTNIKMFDFMAVGLPTISTPIGARGIETGNLKALLESKADNFCDVIREVISNHALRDELAKGARELVECNYSWEKISQNLGSLLREKLNNKKQLIIDSTKVNKQQLQDEEVNSKDLTCPADYKKTNNDHYKRNIALITTWGVRCGIAEHSKYLVDELNRFGVKCTILANSDQEDEKIKIIGKSDTSTKVYRIWQIGKIKASNIISECQRNQIDHINVQYHKGFFNEQALIDIIQKSKKAGIKASVTLHNHKNMSLETLIKLGNLNVPLVVHSKYESKRLIETGVQGITHIPIGVFNQAGLLMKNAHQKNNNTFKPVIGNFGFLRRHKGLLELIESISILRELYPDIRLVGLNALYPSEDSVQYLAECNSAINRLELTKHVQLQTNYLDISQVIKYLNACDVIVLPYHYSDEGGSAAANIALASRRPLITTRQEIFREISGAIYQIENPTPSVLAVGLANVLSSPMLLENLEEKCATYIEENSWSRVAYKYLKYVLEY